MEKKNEKDEKKGHKRAEKREKALEAETERRKAAEAERDALNERLLRLQADFENFRKRTLREKNEIYRRANQDIIQELLPVLDHLDLALDAAAHTHKEKDMFFEGIELILEQMLSVLKKFGVVPIDTKGQQFDPNKHEAISHITSGEGPENAVITQVRRGYMLGDKLLRAAQVVVAGKDQRTTAVVTQSPPAALPPQSPPEASPRPGREAMAAGEDGGQRTDEKDQMEEKEGK